MTVSWVTPIASGSSRAGIAGIWAGPETEVTGRPRSSVLLLCRPLRGGSRARPRPRAFHRVRPSVTAPRQPGALQAGEYGDRPAGHRPAVWGGHPAARSSGG